MDSAGGGGGGGSSPKGGDNNLESGGYHHDNHHDQSNHHQPHHQYFSGVALKITLLFVVIGITCLLLNQSAYPTEFFQRSYSLSGPKNSSRGNLSSSPSCGNHTAMQQNVSSPFHQFTSENLPSPVS